MSKVGMFFRGLAAGGVALFVAMAAQANVTVPGIFTDNMVLQRGVPVPVWGLAEPKERITVTFMKQKQVVETDETGFWFVKLDALTEEPAGQTLVVDGKNTLTFKNVVVGDVWICSGQSNMEWALGGCNAPEDIKTADLPQIRQIKVAHDTAGQPLTKWSKDAEWTVCSPKTAANFTAVGFYFARRINQDVKVPVGLVNVNWGGTRIEPWTASEGLSLIADQEALVKKYSEALPAFNKNLEPRLAAMEKWLAEARAAVQGNTFMPPMPEMPVPAYQQMPHALYNAMIRPMVPFAIKGVIWYQGESNGAEGEEEYFNKMKALIGGWRAVWKQNDFPFYSVQLANFGTPAKTPAADDGYARVRMAQARALSMPKTGLAVTIDIGEFDNIHPKNKFDVGNRLALWALHDEYGKADVVPSGPLYSDYKIEDNSIRVNFVFAESGLMVGKKDGRNAAQEVKDGALVEFAIAGKDKRFHAAKAVIDGNSVVVSSPDVKEPVAVRYAFSQSPVGANLYNKAGLPASPFRTDSW